MLNESFLGTDCIKYLIWGFSKIELWLGEVIEFSNMVFKLCLLAFYSYNLSIYYVNNI